MTARSLTKVAVISFALAVSTSAHAQFGGLSLPGKMLGGGEATTENAGDVVKNASAAMLSFVTAKVGLIEAVKGADAVAAQKQTLQNIKKGGDATLSKEQMETVVSMDKQTGESVNQMIAENAKIDGKNKAKASASMIDYVKGLVSAQKTVTSATNLSKNPMAMTSNAGQIIYLAKELPGILSSGIQSTSALFSYLNSNGVDTGVAKKAAADLGT